MPDSETSAGAGRVVGRYVLYDQIAAGGMASVHVGRLLGPVGFSRTIAIKRLHAQLARDPQFVSMFLDEARLAARVRHPNVVSIIDVVALAGELFLVMEYVQGESLSRLLRATRGGRIPLEIGLTVVADALYGLHAAHEAKSEAGEPLQIVHRDVSPHNVIVGKDGVARVLDFGVAKAASRLQTTGEGQIKGKFAYISPEQLKTEPVDRRADVFAASIMLWEVLTGQRLFSADDPAGIVARVLNQRIEPPSKLVPGLPRAIDEIVMKGLERDVNRRFSTAQEMARAIEASTRLARPADVGAWVERTVGGLLRRRAERIAEIERSAPSTPRLGDSSEGASAGEPTVVLRDPATPSPTEQSASVRTDLSSATASPARRKTTRRVGAVIGAVAVGVVGLAAILVWLRYERGDAGTKGQPLPAAATSAADPRIVHPVPSAMAPTAPTPGPATPALSSSANAGSATKNSVPRRSDCNPPFYFDDDGLKRYKPKCI
jgi:serine/threonine-protein kinase